MIAFKNSLLGPSVLLLASAPLSADTIYKTDGRTVEDITVSKESLLEVEYKQDRTDATIPSDEVLRIEFSKMPEELDEAEGFLAEGDILSAMQYLDSYVDGQIEKSTERKYKWAPAYAAYRSIELRMQVADLKGARARCSRLIDNFPDSRYLPLAYLAKASCEAWMGSGSTATETLTAMSEVIRSRGLSARWDLECRLAKVRATRKGGAAQRAELASIGGEAGSRYPNVRSRAKVAEGESYLAEAEGTNDSAAAKELRAKAKGVFDEIIDDDAADDEALAAAYTGLGDCLFYKGAAADDQAVLKEAVKNYLRVVVNHEAQSQYVPKALYYSFRCFELMDERSRRADMRRELLNLYPDSEWAAKPDVK